MSLLDDVSIVVTPNGYKAGELYAVVPVPTEGSEKIVNGDFATDTDWTKGTGWSISGGTANCNNTSGSTQNLKTENRILNLGGKRVQISFTVSNYSGSASMTVTLQGTGGNDFSGINANGTYTTLSLISPTDNSIDLLFKASNGWVGSIDNVSVKEYTSADMDVTRATAATRVDENGLVNYAEVLGDSILTGNNSNFDTGIGSWVGYNGGTLAHSTDKLEVTLTTGESGARINTNGLISGGQVGKTFKVRARVWQGTTTSTTLQIYIGGTQENINISSTPTYFEVELTPPNSGDLFIYKGGSVDTGTYFIDDVTVKEVTRDNVPRIDYTGGGCPHILAEPQRTNEYKESTNIDNWTFSNATGTSNYSVSPDGTQNASRLLFSGSGYAFRGLAQLSGVEYTVSVYAKRNDSGTQSFGFFVNGSGAIDSQLNITSEWKRFTYTYTTTNTYETGLAGDSGADISFYGYQKEQGSYATSLIPTSGSAVTRNQDIFTRDGIGSLINSEEGVLFLEISGFENDNVNRYISLCDGSSSNDIRIFYYNDGGTVFFRKTVNNINVITTSTGTINQSASTKIAIRYNSTNFDVFSNGVKIITTLDSNNFANNTLNTIYFTDSNGVSYPFNGKLKQLQIFKTALTDSELIALTTI